MPRQYISRKHTWDATGRESSWDKEDKAPKPKRDKHFNRLCRVCALYLVTHAEDKIGVHIACVQAMKIKQNMMPRGRPGYGTGKR